MQVCYPSVYEELKRVCASCKFQRICAQDLASGDVESGMRIYCPNAPVIDVDDVVWDIAARGVRLPADHAL